MTEIICLNSCSDEPCTKTIKCTGCKNHNNFGANILVFKCPLCGNPMADAQSELDYKNIVKRYICRDGHARVTISPPHPALRFKLNIEAYKELDLVYHSF
jgi:hypothetical protein